MKKSIAKRSLNFCFLITKTVVLLFLLISISTTLSLGLYVIMGIKNAVSASASVSTQDTVKWINETPHAPYVIANIRLNGNINMTITRSQLTVAAMMKLLTNLFENSSSCKDLTPTFPLNIPMFKKNDVIIIDHVIDDRLKLGHIVITYNGVINQVIPDLGAVRQFNCLMDSFKNFINV
jgi:hypothetical protein